MGTTSSEHAAWPRDAAPRHRSDGATPLPGATRNTPVKTGGARGGTTGPRNPTLAETGGLPPVRRPGEPAGAFCPEPMRESRTITRKSASNLAMAFVLLPRAKRDGMSALYAFCREVDDVADDETIPVRQRRAQLAAWREDVRRACGTETPQFPVNRELQPVIHQYHLPFEHFDALLKGVEMDLDIKRYETYDALELYCYRVASVVGLLSIEVFGYRDPACREYAVFLGKALQLTNILRDVQSDAKRGRIYLPLSELARFKVAPEEILRLEYSPALLRVGEKRGRARPAFLSAGPRDPARGGPPLDDRRGVDGLGLLAAAAQAGGAAVQRLRPRAHAPELADKRPCSSCAPGAGSSPARRRRAMALSANAEDRMKWGQKDIGPYE